MSAKNHVKKYLTAATNALAIALSVIKESFTSSVGNHVNVFLYVRTNAKNLAQSIVLLVNGSAKIVATIATVPSAVVCPAYRVGSLVCGNANTINARKDVVKCVIVGNAMNPAVNL